jgi:hypothetical protein
MTGLLNVVSPFISVARAVSYDLLSPRLQQVILTHWPHPGYTNRSLSVLQRRHGCHYSLFNLLPSNF